MIAGKTTDEILSMNHRYRWYKTISPEEKAEAMRVVKIERHTKTSGENNHMYGKMSGENNPMNRPEVRAKHREAVNLPEYKAKISVSSTEMWKDPEYRAKMSAVRTGKIHSEATRAKISASKMGTVFTEEHRAKISENAKLRVGDKNPSWLGGKSFEPYGVEFNDELKRQIRARDNHTCQECLRTEEQLYCALDVHHIDYDKRNNSPENLIALCRSCHAKTGFGREDWTEYFGGSFR